MARYTCNNCGTRLTYLEESQNWYCIRCDKKFHVSPAGLEPVLSEWEEKLQELEKRGGTILATYDALYYGGYGSVRNLASTIVLLADCIYVDILNELSAEVPYGSIEVLHMHPEREITALRTYAIGPVLAAAFKKETHLLTIGFRDKLGILQIPSFKIAENDKYGGLDRCYTAIVEQIRKTKHS